VELGLASPYRSVWGAQERIVVVGCGYPSRNAPERPEGWEARLSAVLREASVREFNPQTWNCALFARACAEAVSGRELPTRLSRTLETTVDRLFPRHPDPRLARRGDVVLAYLDVKTLGVCVGPEVAFVTTKGLHMTPRSTIHIAWRV
jgi:hypothetical protein